MLQKQLQKQSCSIENVFFKISQNSTENTRAGVSFLTKVTGWKWRPSTLLKIDSSASVSM